MAVKPVVADEAEESVLGALLASPDKLGEVITAGLSGEHFLRGHNRVIFDALVEAFYSDEPTDPLTIGSRVRNPVATSMGCDEATAVRHVQALAQGRAFAGDVTDHAKLVRRAFDGRRLLELAASIERAVAEDQMSPDEIAGAMSEAALRLAAATHGRSEIVPLLESGRRGVRALRESMAARAQGIESGAYFGIPALDNYLHGMRGGELMILGGEPGVGKSAVGWRAALNFAERQMRKPADKRVGALVLSLEMSEEPSNLRMMQALAEINGTELREGRIDDRQLERIVDAYRKRSDVPLFFNYAPNMRTSQLKVLLNEAVRRHNIGLVVVDHFRMFDPDKRLANMRGDEVDEEKARFLKESIAKELNMAVICLAHTRKKDSAAGDPRPRLSDLRGSGQIAAHSDFVAFIHRPASYASEDEIASGAVQQHDAEMIWAKNRHALDGRTEFFFKPETMVVL